MATPAINSYDGMTSGWYIVQNRTGGMRTVIKIYPDGDVSWSGGYMQSTQEYLLRHYKVIAVIDIFKLECIEANNP